MKRTTLEPILAGGITTIAWVTVLSAAPAVIRTPAAVALLGILPGYAVVKALALGRSIGVVEAALLAVGASLSLVVILSVGIGLSVAELRGPVVATVLYGVILVMLTLRWYVDWRAVSEDASPQHAAARWSPSRLRVDNSVIGWGLGGALAIGALTVAVLGSQSALTDVVQFWATSAPGGAMVGIRNDAATASTYRFTIGPTDADAESRDVTVSAGQQWLEFVAFPALWPQGAAIEADLYATGEPTPFRVVRLTPQPSSLP